VSPELTFLGAAGTVTGSRYLLRDGSSRLLVDCGLFQGLKQLRLRNWAPFPVPPREIDAVALTHAHLDHSGYLPVVIRGGFAGPVFATPATRDLCGILLPDSGHLQEEEAERANRKGYSRHHPALPLYTQAEAEASLARFESVPFERPQRVGGFTLRFRPAGHILGAATLAVEHRAGTVVFSGDLGRPNDPVMRPPDPVRAADWLVVESTYGDRLHPEGAGPEAELGEIVRRTAARGGVLVVPAFAVGRAQMVLYLLHRLRRHGVVPPLPVYIDSPMAADALDVLLAYAGEHRLSAAECRAMVEGIRITRSVEESKAIDAQRGPMIVISASGMATGGRVLFHLERFAPDHRNTVLLVGHQAAGTRGDTLVRGGRQLKIHGRWVPVRAEVAVLDGLSAHADAAEIIEWLGGFERPPRATFVTHGEPVAADALRLRIEQELGWPVRVPEQGETVALGGQTSA
jgi:metallo-beta-lactamase family protein